MENSYINVQAKVLDMYANGHSMEKIADSVSESPYNVNKILIENEYYIEHYDDEGFFEFKKLYGCGKSLKEICETMNTSADTIFDYYYKYICKLYDSNMTCEEIAEMVHCPLDSIVSIIKRMRGKTHIPKIYTAPKEETIENKLDRLIMLVGKLVNKIN